MQYEHQASVHSSLLERVRAWWGGSRARWARLDEIDDLSPDEIAWLAEDAGMASDELIRVVHKPNGTAGLLERRLAALGLNPEDICRIAPELLGDLERTCACCPDKARCVDDMKEDPLAPGWESYCPNSGTLRTLT